MDFKRENNSIQSVITELEQGRRVSYLVDGCDMNPFFRSGKDSVLLSPPNKKADGSTSIRRRDIVLFRYAQDTTIKLHRVVHVWGTLLLLRGDGNYGHYERATVSDVIGVVAEGTVFGGCHFKANSSFWRFISKLWTLSYRFRLWIMLCGKGIMRVFRKIFLSKDKSLI